MSVPLRIVAADDDPAMRLCYEQALPSLGHQVRVAHNGWHLVELCRAVGPDLIIADVKMPGLDGIEAVAAVAREREVPAILVSAYDDPGLLERAGAWPVMAYLVKPVKLAGLDATISLALARFEQVQQLRWEAADLRQALEDRQLVERAKRAFMRLGRPAGLDEEEAYHGLRKMASDQNRRLADVARAVLKAETVIRARKEPRH